MKREVYAHPLPVDRILTLEPAGRVGIDNSRLAEYLTLTEAEWDRIDGIILDCARLEFVTSTSLSPIILLHIRSHMRNKKYVLVNVQPKVKRVLDTTRLSVILKLMESHQVAKAFIRG